MTLKQKVAIGTDINQHPVYPTVEFIQEINKMNAGNLGGAVLTLQNAVNQLRVSLDALTARVEALE